MKLTKKNKTALTVAAIVLISVVAAYLIYRRKKGAKVIAFPPLYRTVEAEEDAKESDFDQTDITQESKENIETGEKDNVISISKEKATENSDYKESGMTVGQGRTPATAFPLKLGSQGKEVEQLQIYLMKNSGGFDADQLDGFFGHYTLERLQKHLHRDQMSEQNFYKRKINEERTYKYKISC